ncbi:hypothetical protein I4U23_030326 [Adineta vaga]|nr:hypothetical protein I4U23_030326 [Adineta vaga]
MKSIRIVGFTPLGVILAERFTYLQTNLSKIYSDIHLIERISCLSNDIHWQSIGHFCLLNLLKQCRSLQSDNSKKFGINVQHVIMNEQLLYSYLKLAIERMQKYYLSLLKYRQIKFELFNDQIESSDEDRNKCSLNKHILNDETMKIKPIYLYNQSSKSNDRLLNNDEFESSMKTDTNSSIRTSYCTYITYGQSFHTEFNQSLRLNSFHAIFQYLLSCPTIKIIGLDIFAFELAYLFWSVGHNEIYLYRMNPHESSMLPITKTNGNLVILFQIFSKFMHKPLIQTTSKEIARPFLHIIEHFHQFRMNSDAEGRLEYEKYIGTVMPTNRTLEETKKHKRTYLETFRQRTQESFTKFSTSHIQIDTNNDIKEELLEDFPPSSTFFVLSDVNTSFDVEPSLKSSFPNAICTFNSTPGALIQNIYKSLRTIANDEQIPDLTNVFLSIDHELCVIQNQTSVKDGQFGIDEIVESQQHDLQQPLENLHDLYKIIQRPINSTGRLTLYESQLFQNDALDLQSLLLFFNPHDRIPKNELMFLFHNEHDWHNLLVLPNRLTIKNNN